jgi:hypothetical protein
MDSKTSGGSDDAGLSPEKVAPINGTQVKKIIINGNQFEMPKFNGSRFFGKENFHNTTLYSTARTNTSKLQKHNILSRGKET